MLAVWTVQFTSSRAVRLPLKFLVRGFAEFPWLVAVTGFDYVLHPRQVDVVVFFNVWLQCWSGTPPGVLQAWHAHPGWGELTHVM
jgi:hypothetical protein